MGRLLAMSDKERFETRLSCNGCPCLNSDYESGSDCNLDYETDLRWTKDKNLLYCSTNCELKSVRYGDGKKFIPEGQVLVTNTHPMDWVKL